MFNEQVVYSMLIWTSVTVDNLVYSKYVTGATIFK